MNNTHAVPEAEPITDSQHLCDCPSAGYCERHQCLKTEHWHTLCQTRSDYFQLWEEGRGPGQHRVQTAAPGLLQKASNFGKAVVKHISSGRKVVDESTYEQRLAICRKCPSLDHEKMICREKECGCYVERKARWSSQKCPLQKWLFDSGSVSGEISQTSQDSKP